MKQNMLEALPTELVELTTDFLPTSERRALCLVSTSINSILTSPLTNLPKELKVFIVLYSTLAEINSFRLLSHHFYDLDISPALDKSLIKVSPASEDKEFNYFVKVSKLNNLKFKLNHNKPATQLFYRPLGLLPLELKFTPLPQPEIFINLNSLTLLGEIKHHKPRDQAIKESCLVM